MKTFASALVLPLALILLGPATYAGGMVNPTTGANTFPPMVLPVAGPAVGADVTPGAGPWTSSSPIAAREPMSPASPPQRAESPAPATKVEPLTNPTGDIFARAKEAFMRSDLKTAADEIRRGAAVLRMEEPKASLEVRRDLDASAAQLERLAQDIEQAKVKAEAEFDAVFTRAGEVLAHQPAAPAHPAESYAANEKAANAQTGHKPEELNRRIAALQKEIATLQKELSQLKSQESGTKL